MLVLEKLDQKAEEREVKRIRLEAEIEDKRREKEREHEMQMQGMMLSFMQQMVSTMARGQSSSVTPSIPHAPPTTSPYHPSLYHSDDYNSDN